MPSTQSIVLFLVVSLGAITIYWVGRTCVFSAVKAQLILNGKPVLHTKVIRRWEWNSQKSDESITDEQGFVTFPAVFEFSISRFLPIELVIAQGVYIVRDGEEKKIWSNSKRKSGENTEYGGARFDVVCELANERILIEDYGSLMVTMCKLNTLKK